MFSAKVSQKTLDWDLKLASFDLEMDIIHELRNLPNLICTQLLANFEKMRTYFHLGVLAHIL